MGRRVHIPLDAHEPEADRKAARAADLTRVEWARQVLRRAARRNRRSASEKLAALDRALLCGHPTASIGHMLQEIARGCGIA